MKYLVFQIRVACINYFLPLVYAVGWVMGASKALFKVIKDAMH